MSAPPVMVDVPVRQVLCVLYSLVAFIPNSAWGAEMAWWGEHIPPTNVAWVSFPYLHHTCMWVEFVVGSRPGFERFFSGYSGFPFACKTNISKFQFHLEIVPIRL